MRSRRSVLAVVVAVAVTGCGSTVQQSGTAVADLGGSFDAGLSPDTPLGGDELAVSPQGQPGVGGDQTGTFRPGGAAGSGRGTSPREPGSAPGVAGPGTKSGGSAAVQAPGVTATSIKVGLEKVQGEPLDTGAAGIDRMDVNHAVETLVKYVNGTGGVGGRKLEPVYFVADAGSTESSDEAQCATYTQDNRVFAALTRGGDDVLNACLAKRGVAHTISRGTAQMDQKRFTTFAGLLDSGGLTYDRTGQIMVEGLHDGGWFTPISKLQPLKLGILSFAQERYRSGVDRGMKPALRVRGIPITDEVYIEYEPSTLTAAIANAALRFKSQDITHVMFMGVDAVLPYYFSRAAQSQGYHPRYGLSSNDAPGVLQQQASTEDQWEGAMGVGWVPMTDVDASRDPGDWPARKHCRTALATGGIKTFPSRDAEAQAMALCDSFFFFKAAFEASPVLSRAGLAAGAEALGSTWESAVSGRASFGPAKHYGAGVYRLLRYERACTCFRYGARVRAIPPPA